MYKPRPREIAVATIFAGISAYELLCPDTETISEFFDPHMEKRWRQMLLLGAGAITLAHISNVTPDRLDPFEQGLSRIRQAYKRRNAWTN